MEIKSRDLSNEDFYLLFQDLRPVPINYFHLFLAITAALLLSSALQFLAADTYAKHQLALLQKEVAMQSRGVTQSSPVRYELADPERSALICDMRKQEYSANPVPIAHAAMAQACTNAGMPY